MENGHKYSTPSESSAQVQSRTSSRYRCENNFCDHPSAQPISYKMNALAFCLALKNEVYLHLKNINIMR